MKKLLSTLMLMGLALPVSGAFAANDTMTPAPVAPSVNGPTANAPTIPTPSTSAVTPSTSSPSVPSAANTSDVTPSATATAAAQNATTIQAARTLPEGSEVTVVGTVESYDSRHPFTLRDSTGTISIDTTYAKAVALHNGEQITVTGDLTKSLLGTDLQASDIHL